MSKPVSISVLLLFGMLTGVFGYPQPFHTPAEILQLMTKSQIRYELLITEEAFEPIEPGVLESTSIYQSKEDGRIRLSEYSIDSTGQHHFQLGLADLDQANFEDARTHFQNILTSNHEYSPALTGIGRSYLAEDKISEAKEWFTRAIGANFHNYQAHRYLAEAYDQEKEGTEAMREIAIAWVLNRNDITLQTKAEEIIGHNRKKFKEWTFQPKIRFIQTTEDTVIVIADEAWAPYALCKSFWTYERGYRKAMTGSRSGPSIMEEQECLFNLISTHTPEKGKVKSGDPVIDELVRAKNASLINEFIFFEIWLYQEPLIAYTQPREVVEGLAEYVLRIRVK